MLEQFGSLEQATDFFLTQHNRKLFATLDRRKLDPFVIHSLDPIGKSEGVNGKLEVGI